MYSPGKTSKGRSLPPFAFLSSLPFFLFPSLPSPSVPFPSSVGFGAVSVASVRVSSGSPSVPSPSSSQFLTNLKGLLSQFLPSFSNPFPRPSLLPLLPLFLCLAVDSEKTLQRAHESPYRECGVHRHCSLFARRPGRALEISRCLRKRQDRRSQSCLSWASHIPGLFISVRLGTRVKLRGVRVHKSSLCKKRGEKVC